MSLQPRRIALALNNITPPARRRFVVAFWRVLAVRAPKHVFCFGYQMKLLKKENDKDDQNFLYREIEAGSRTGLQVEWMQNDLIEEGKAGSLSRLRLPAPPRVPLWATRQYLHAYTNCSVPMKPTRSKNYMLALIVINQMGIRSQALSSRQRAPPSVYPSASGVRAPPHVG